MTDHGATHPAGGTATAVARDARLAEWQRLQAEIAQLHARANEVLAESLGESLAEVSQLSGPSREREIPLRSMVAEYAAAARMSEFTVEALAFDARRLMTTLPDTHRALADGQISLAHAREIAQVPFPAGAPADRIAEFELLVLDRATQTTARRTRVYARVLAQKMFPTDLPARHRAAREARHVRVTDFDDGMSDLTVHGPTVLIRAGLDRVTQLARATQDAARDHAHDVGATEERDTRTLDQVRADVAVDLLLTAAPATVGADTAAPITARVQVTIPVRTLAGLSDDGAELDGAGLVDAELIRELAGLAGGWERLFIDPLTDAVIRTDRYQPTAGMRRFLRARDQHCRFPGCRTPVNRCQIDHSHDHALGGPTALGNLAHLCARHHPLKHPDIPDPYRWSVRQVSGGVLEWQSPSGRRYIDEPPPRVAFAAVPDSSADVDPPWLGWDAA